jgi:hypothetical protein
MLLKNNKIVELLKLSIDNKDKYFRFINILLTNDNLLTFN